MANQVSVEVLLEIKAAQDGIKNLEKQIDKMSANAGKGIKSLDVAIGAFAGSLAAAGFQKVLSGAKDLFSFMITDGVAAAQAQEEAINKMNIALQSTGRYTEATSLDMQKFSSYMQETTKFADELVLENMALIQSLGDLSEQGLKDATQAAADLASALGIDLKTAATLVGKAAAGEVGSFSRYGLAIKKGADDAETFANALDAINSKFGGAASGQIKTFTGATAQLTNTIGDLQEKFGEVIIKNPAVIAAIGILNKGFLELQKVMEESKGKFEPLITLLAETFGQAAEAFFKATSLIIKGLALMAEWIGSNSNAVDFLRTVFGNMVPGMTTFIALMDKINGETPGAEVKKVADQMLYLQENADKAKGSFENLFTDLPPAPEIISPLMPPEQLAEQILVEQAQLDKAAEDKLAKQVAFEDSLKAIKDQYKLADAEEKVAQQELELAMADENKIAEQQFLIQRLDELAFIKLDAQIKEATARGDHLKALKLMEEKAHKEETIENREHVKTKKEIQDEEISNRAKTFATIAGLQDSSNKTLAVAGKAMAIYEATMNTYRGISMALGGSGLPIPANFVAAALVGAAGAAQVAKIAGISFAEGGIVPGVSYSGDRVQANVNSGEMVLNKRQQENLFNSIDNGGGGMGGVNINIQGNVIADDESQVMKLIDRINDAMEFSNAKLKTA